LQEGEVRQKLQSNITQYLKLPTASQDLKLEPSISKTEECKNVQEVEKISLNGQVAMALMAERRTKGGSSCSQSEEVTNCEESHNL